MLQATALAERAGSTVQFIPQILMPMVRAGWISSEPGPRGGYRLATDLRERSLIELIELIEGPTDDGRCVLDSTGCSADDPCSLHDAWQWARAALIERLAATAISAKVPNMRGTR